MKIHIDTSAEMDKAKASNVKQGKNPNGSPLPKGKNPASTSPSPPTSPPSSQNKKKPASPASPASSPPLQQQAQGMQAGQQPVSSKPLPKRPPKEKTPPQDVAQARKRQTQVLKERQGRELKNPGEPTVRAIDAGAGSWPPLAPVL